MSQNGTQDLQHQAAANLAFATAAPNKSCIGEPCSRAAVAAANYMRQHAQHAQCISDMCHKMMLCMNTHRHQALTGSTPHVQQEASPFWPTAADLSVTHSRYCSRATATSTTVQTDNRTLLPKTYILTRSSSPGLDPWPVITQVSLEPRDIDKQHTTTAILIKRPA
jgi:hypothetical protein